MLRRFKPVTIILSVATIIWIVLLFQSLQAYGEYTRGYHERCERIRRKAREEGLNVDFFGAESYSEWNGGRIILISGFVLLCIWIVRLLHIYW